MNSESETPATAGLLETILADPVLIARMSKSHAISLTVTLAFDADGRAQVDHPALRESTSGNAVRIRDAAEGFVPVRPIAAPGQRPDETTEYRLVGLLGSGGTGVVYQAHQRAIDREVAVKVLRDELAADSASRQRFLQEARTIGSLDHPNVIALHELGTGPQGGLFYSMKRVDGTSWDQKVDDFTLVENVDTLLRVCNAIRYAHSRGLIHRDIKPENVMIGQFGEVLLADWGLALSTAADEPLPTGLTIGGTPAYMAPELATGEASRQSVRTDVYLLGAVLFRILTGQSPHWGDTLLDCIRAAAENQIRPTKLRGGWIDLAMKAMHTDPAGRFADVDRFIEAIGQQQSHEESNSLLRRALKRIESQGDGVSHQDYSVSEALVRESLDLWPENREAGETLARLQADHARAAAAHGDYDLALSLLEESGQAETELAARIRRKRERRREQAVREAKFSALFTQSPDAGLLTTAGEGEIVEANEMFERLTGFDPKQIVGRKILDIHLWTCSQKRTSFLEQLGEDGSVEEFQTPVNRADGSVFEASISARRLAMGSEEFVLTTLRDITKRKEAERALKRSQDRLRDMQHLAQLGTWELDVASGTVRWSEETFRLAGLPVEHGAPNLDEYLKTIHPDDREKVSAAIATTIEYHVPYQVQIRHLRPNGSWNTVIARGQPIEDAEGHVAEIYGVVIDITRQAREIERLRGLLDDQDSGPHVSQPMGQQ